MIKRIIELVLFLNWLFGSAVQAQDVGAEFGLPYMSVQDSIIKMDYDRRSVYNDLFNDYYGLEGLCIRAFVGWCKAYADVDSVVVFEYEPSLMSLGRTFGRNSEQHWQEQIDFFNQFAFSRQSHYDRLNVMELLKLGICMAEVRVRMAYYNGLEYKVRISAAIPEKSNFPNYQNVYFLYTFKLRLNFFEEDNRERFYRGNLKYDDIFDENGFIDDTILTYQLLKIETWGPYSQQLDMDNPPISVKSILSNDSN